MIINDKEKSYLVEEITWNNDEQDYENEEQYWDLNGVDAMKKIADYLVRHPNAEDSTGVYCEDEDGMFIAMREKDENGNEYWLEAYCFNK